MFLKFYDIIIFFMSFSKKLLRKHSQTLVIEKMKCNTRKNEMINFDGFSDKRLYYFGFIESHLGDLCFIAFI